MSTFENDIIKDMLQHRALVSVKMSMLGNELGARGRRHDNSVSSDGEMSLAKMADDVLGDNDYEEFQRLNDILRKSHYEANDHHPEHFTNGFDDMDTLQLTEFICNELSHDTADYDNVENVISDIKERYPELDHTLLNIIKNTMNFIMNKEKQTTGLSLKGVSDGKTKKE